MRLAASQQDVEVDASELGEKWEQQGQQKGGGREREEGRQRGGDREGDRGDDGRGRGRGRSAEEDGAREGGRERNGDRGADRCGRLRGPGRGGANSVVEENIRRLYCRERGPGCRCGTVHARWCPREGVCWVARAAAASPFR